MKKHLIIVLFAIGSLLFLSQCRLVGYVGILYMEHLGDGYNKSEPYAITSKDNTSISSDSLLNLFYEFQMSHPDYQFMEKNEEGELSHYFHEKGGDYNYDFVYFYFKDIDIIAVCFFEELKDSTLLVNLNAICNGTSFGEWRGINEFRKKSDERISRRENRQIKKKFETEILDASGVKWKRFKRPKYNLKKLNELYGDSYGDSYNYSSYSIFDYKFLNNRNENNDSYDFENYPIGNDSSGSVKATLTAGVGDFVYESLNNAFPDTNIMDPFWCFSYGIEITGDYPDEDCPIILHSLSFTTIDGDTIPFVLYYRTFEEWEPRGVRKENTKYYYFLPTDSFPLNLTGITRKILANCHKPKELRKIYVNYDIEVEGQHLVVHSLWGW